MFIYEFLKNSLIMNKRANLKITNFNKIDKLNYFAIKDQMIKIIASLCNNKTPLRMSFEI